MSRVLGWLSEGLTAAIMIAFVVLFFAGGTFARDACVHRDTGDVRHSESWKLDPLAWFGAGSISADEVCEKETFSLWLMGQLPVVGDSLEQFAGGPQNPDYYDGN